MLNILYFDNPDSDQFLDILQEKTEFNKDFNINRVHSVDDVANSLNSEHKPDCLMVEPYLVLNDKVKRDKLKELMIHSRQELNISTIIYSTQPADLMHLMYGMTSRHMDLYIPKIKTDSSEIHQAIQEINTKKID